MVKKNQNIEQQAIQERAMWSNRQWYEYLFQNGLMDIETFRKKCYDIVDEMIEGKYGKSQT